MPSVPSEYHLYVNRSFFKLSQEKNNTIYAKFSLLNICYSLAFNKTCIYLRKRENINEHKTTFNHKINKLT